MKEIKKLEKATSIYIYSLKSLGDPCKNYVGSQQVKGLVHLNRVLMPIQNSNKCITMKELAMNLGSWFSRSRFELRYLWLHNPEEKLLLGTGVPLTWTIVNPQM